MTGSLKPAFTYFGAKTRVADEVWRRFGRVSTYIEGFAGSLAVLLANPRKPKLEIVNDKDCYIANFYRALQADPDEVSKYADQPVNHADLMSRHKWLVEQEEFRKKIASDSKFYDAEIAGTWVWGINNWIGQGWCAVGSKPSAARPALDRPTKRSAQRPHIAGGQGTTRKSLSAARPHIGSGRGIQASTRGGIQGYLWDLAERLRDTRVLCGDWSRCCTDFILNEAPPAAIFLDPPYSKEAGRDEQIYSVEDLSVAHVVREWCIKHGDDPRLRIALCGFEGEHDMPEGWSCWAWKTGGGFSTLGDGTTRGKVNAARERIWFSRYCNNSGFEDLF